MEQEEEEEKKTFLKYAVIPFVFEVHSGSFGDRSRAGGSTISAFCIIQQKGLISILPGILPRARHHFSASGKAGVEQTLDKPTDC
jgi:hypothetical protein